MAKTVLKTSLDHLPPRFQQDLQAIKALILEHYAKTDMIILFGSFARGDYVEDTTQENGTTYEYTSDYDIMIVTQRNINLLGLKWQKLRTKIDKRPTPIPTTLITHNVHFLNHKIKNNYYFFLDIIKEGIMLHDSGKYDLAVPGELTPEKRLKKAKKYRNHYMAEGNGFLKISKFCIGEQDYRKAAFLLHQAVESYYAALSLVYTDYKPKTHDLEALRQRGITIHEGLKEAFPLGTKAEQERFELLRKAYVDARYDLNYKITAEELQYLIERAMVLRGLIEQLCEEEIVRLQAQF